MTVSQRHSKWNLENSESFKFKARITERTPTDGNTKNVEIVAPLKYLINFWRTVKWISSKPGQRIMPIPT